MDNTSILNKIRDLKVLVLNPESETSNSLVLQLTRIGCPVRYLWPLPQKLDFKIDVIFHGIFKDNNHSQFKNLVSSYSDDITLISIIEYESPTILSQILEIGSHGVISSPLVSHDVLPQLVMARRNSEDLWKKEKNAAKLNDKLSSMASVNKAKVEIMKQSEVTEEEAHKYLSKLAMETRKTIIEVSEEIILNYKNK